MRIDEYIAQSKKTFFTYEILPPLKGKRIDVLFDILDPLMEFKPPFINVTYHRAEYIYKKVADNGFKKVFVRKRPGSVGICAGIMNRYKVDAVPHLICGGFNPDTTEDALIDLSYLGVQNVLLLRGDATKSEGVFTPDEGGHEYAVDLVRQVKHMNEGNFLAEELKGVSATNFAMGVAGYPEKHFEAANMKSDLKFLKMKVDAGATFIVTQMFFDNEKYKDFVTMCRAAGITIPIIPGIKPITTKKQLTVIPRTFNVDIPEDLYEAVDACKDNKAVRQVGIEWAIQQSKDLVKFGVPCLHYYTMSRPEIVVKISRAVF